VCLIPGPVSPPAYIRTSGFRRRSCSLILDWRESVPSSWIELRARLQPEQQPASTRAYAWSSPPEEQGSSWKQVRNKTLQRVPRLTRLSKLAPARSPPKTTVFDFDSRVRRGGGGGWAIQPEKEITNDSSNTDASPQPSCLKCAQRRLSDWSDLRRPRPRIEAWKPLYDR
jgi:hypothetical protein